ncbi:rod shape-determining protein MreC [Acidicapsa ligni]|uniref:rod shape-determining protein MreC n=1 Tax=Acidicapsa ligni TaxID=542300 RepID=UPI0021E09AF9|nr:rod shape-determining protein MreC [Acidicapsa ligni]
MESFFSRYRNLIVLLAALLLQVIGLAVQVRKPAPIAGSAMAANSHENRDGSGVRLIRLWASGLVTPFERAIHGTSSGASGLWGNYLDLRHTREENKQLQETIDRLRLEQASLIEDARQGQRLQGLLGFSQSYIYQTVPAQVIGTSGSLVSRVIVLDKGSLDGLKPDMAVITPDGIVGKVRDVFQHSAQVLLINDQTSGAGVILETTRIRGILRGNAAGQPQVVNILADQRIQPGEKVLTAGGDQIFPRGLPVGVVERVARDPDRGSFINVIIKSSANLQHLDEVLVITALDAHLSPQQMADLKTSEELKGAEAAADAERKKAALEMSERLPSLTDPNAPVDPNAAKQGANGQPDSGVPVPPPTPKPLPAAHADRFSPGSTGAGAPATGSGDAADGDETLTKPVTSKPVTTKPATSKPVTPKPVTPKPGTQGGDQ